MGIKCLLHCVLVQFYYCLSALPLSLCLLNLSFGTHSCVWLGDWFMYLIMKTALSVFDWMLTERESSQFSCLVSAKLAAAALSALSVHPSGPDHVFPVQFYCSVLALPLSLCLLSVSFRLPLCLDMLRHLASQLVCVP